MRICGVKKVIWCTHGLSYSPLVGEPKYIPIETISKIQSKSIYFFTITEIKLGRKSLYLFGSRLTRNQLTRLNKMGYQV